MMKNSYSVRIDGAVPLDGLGALVDTESEQAGQLAKYANQGDEVALRWIRRLVQYGVTDSLLRELHQKLRSVPTEAYLAYRSHTGRFEWIYGFATERTFPDRDSICAVMVARIINGDQVGRLKRCALEECRKYFVGNAKAKWCSDNCGSKFRARKKRRLDKERQML